MSHYIKQGNTYRVADGAALEITPSLPAGNYVLKFDGFSKTFYLETADAFAPPGKTYGNLIPNMKRIFETFIKRPNSTGVMLTGEKGSGKTLLARMISMHACQQGIPTIIINTAFHGDVFNTFMQDLDTPAIVLFDEFEKVYDADEQKAVLTLFDGLFPSKKLFVLTCNDKYKLDPHMQNRPGRLFYSLEFDSLEPEFIEEYANDQLHPDLLSHMSELLNLTALFPKFNFDMLKALVEEMNRYMESPRKAVKLLNMKPDDDQGTYEITVLRDGIEVDPETMSHSEWRGNPLTQERMAIRYDETDAPGFVWPDDEEEQKKLKPRHCIIMLDQSKMVKMDMAKGHYVYKVEEFTITFSRKKVESYYGRYIDA